MNRLIAVLGLALAIPACASLPEDVATPVRQALLQMDDGTGRPIAPGRLASRVSMGLGGAGWLIDYSKTGDQAWCGTGGCTRELYVARSGGSHRLAFREQVLDWSLKDGPETVLDLELHRAACDALGSEPCLRRFVWNEAGGRFEEALNREGFGYLVGPLFQPTPPVPADYPDAVLAEIERREGLCQAAGGRVDRGGYPAVSAPDLNGDGRRDWILGSPYAACYDPAGGRANLPTMGISVVVSEADQWVVALRVSATAYAVDISVQPARFGLRDETLCAERPGCPVRYYDWKAEDRTLQASGISHWNPTPIPTAETWLDCLVATERTAAASPGRDPTDGHYARMMEAFRNRLLSAQPPLSRLEATERRQVFEDRYDDPEDLEPARWRSDSCVAWL